MKEIEIKAKLINREGVIEKLKALGCVFEPAITQEDTVYTKNTGSLKEFLGNDVYLRIRVKNNGKIFFTLKKNTAVKLVKIEHEVEISSKEEMHQALLLMGYREAVRVDKTRIITHYNGCEICIDDVKNLGSFIEMEKMAEGDGEKIQEELFIFFESIGIKQEDRAFSGYDILMIQKSES